MFKTLALASLITALLFGAMPAQAGRNTNSILWNGGAGNGLWPNAIAPNAVTSNALYPNSRTLNGNTSDGAAAITSDRITAIELPQAR